MSARLVAAAAHPTEGASAETIGALLHSGERFWLDLHAPAEEEYALLGTTFGFHGLAVEDSRHFGQRPKAEDYDDFVFLVVYGWSPDEDGLVEVHCFLTEQFLVTVRRDEAPALDALATRVKRSAGGFPDTTLLLYAAIDGLVDGFFPALEQLDDRLDLIEEHMFA
ncbi:MAG TPA: CorA family divalent cation transporter, partial [Gaiellaceae bacterium]